MSSVGKPHTGPHMSRPPFRTTAWTRLMPRLLQAADRVEGRLRFVTSMYMGVASCKWGSMRGVYNCHRLVKGLED
jgi:hypothetical protein